MNLGQISWPMWALGAAILAGLFFALQRLKVRHREQIVLTTLFWQEAKEEARARSLVERFRHPLAYLLACLLGGLAWLAFADPAWKDQTGMRYTVILDTSQAMSANGRFDRALVELDRQVSVLPRQRTAVVASGAGSRMLLAPGEDRAQLKERLVGLTPEPASQNTASTIGTHILAQHTADAQGEHTFVVIGLEPERAIELPAHAHLVVRSVRRADEVDASPSITALGISPALEAWNQLDVLIQVQAANPDEALPQIQIGELDWKGAVQRTLFDGGAQYRIAGAPADGSVLSVSLPGEHPNATARLRLPTRTAIGVFVAGGLEDSALNLALDSDPAVERVMAAADADVVISNGGQAYGEVPVLRWIPAAEQPYAVFLQHDVGADSQAVLTEALGEFGLDRIDATEWANEAGRAIEMGAQEGPQREVHLWQELLDRDRFGFVESRVFPILVSRSLRWLAGVAPVQPYLAVGELAPQQLSWNGNAFADANEWIPIESGVPDGAAASLLSGPAWRAPMSTETWGTDPVSERGMALLTLILIAALALVGVEWVLYSRGQIP